MPGSTTDCLPKNPNDGSSWTLAHARSCADLQERATSVGAKTTSDGFYSVDLPAGTWSVSAGGFMRILSGPLTVVVEAGADITANYVIDTGIRAAS
jgi:hypothetical protein